MLRLAQVALGEHLHSTRKGHFKLGDGRRCYPLTISDGFSRYLLRCQALEHPDELSSFEVFEAAFCEFAKRSDRGQRGKVPSARAFRSGCFRVGIGSGRADRSRCSLRH